MSWELVKHNFNGNSEDLIEVYFEGMNASKWKHLFAWIEDKVTHLECQYGRVEPAVLDYDSYSREEVSYIAWVTCKSGFEIPLHIVEFEELTFDFEKSEVNSEVEYKQLLEALVEVEGVIGTGKYIVCPEFNKESAFIINGNVVGCRG